MLRVALVVFLVFAVLLLLRALRLASAAVAAFFGPPDGSRGPSPAIEGEMVRDPVCGAWVDRRLALAGRRGSEWLPVCSEKCRGELETGP